MALARACGRLGLPAIPALAPGPSAVPGVVLGNRDLVYKRCAQTFDGFDRRIIVGVTGEDNFGKNRAHKWGNGQARLKSVMMAPEPFLNGIADMACAELNMFTGAHSEVEVSNLAASLNQDLEVVKGCKPAARIGADVFNEMQRDLTVDKVSRKFRQTFWGYRHASKQRLIDYLTNWEALSIP